MAWRDTVMSVWSKFSSGNRIVLEDGELVDSPTDIEDELLESGLYIGSYWTLIRNYTIVPVVFTIFWIVLLFLPRFIWPLEDGVPLPPHTRSLPHPLPELLLGASLWTLVQSLRYPLYALSAGILPRGATLVSIALHTTISILVRPAGLAILRTRHFMDRGGEFSAGDAAFRAVWALALGWALAEGVVAIVQGYQNITVYRKVLVPEDRVAEYTNGEAHVFGDESLEDLNTASVREELLQAYGMPAVYIPTFVPVLQRVASICLALGWTLLVSSAYLRSSLSLTVPSRDRSWSTNDTSNDTPLAITLPIVLVLHFAIAALHTPDPVRALGIHTIAYIGLVIGLAALFAGMGVWGVLI